MLHSESIQDRSTYDTSTDVIYFYTQSDTLSVQQCNTSTHESKNISKASTYT